VFYLTAWATIPDKLKNSPRESKPIDKPNRPKIWITSTKYIKKYTLKEAKNEI